MLLHEFWGVPSSVSSHMSNAPLCGRRRNADLRCGLLFKNVQCCIYLEFPGN